MKRLFNTKKRVALLATLVVVAISAVGAYAYWSSAGMGGGSGIAGTSSPLTVAAAVPSGLTLDGSVTVSGTVTNNTSSNVQITTLSAPVITTNIAGCLPAWFNYADDGTFAAAVGTGENLAPLGAGVQTFGGTLTLPNIVGTDQNLCKGAKYTLTFTAS